LVGRWRGGREPALVDAAAVRSERVVVLWGQLDAPAGHQEGPWDPGRGQAQNALARLERLTDQGRLALVGDRCVGRLGCSGRFLGHAAGCPWATEGLGKVARAAGTPETGFGTPASVTPVFRGS